MKDDRDKRKDSGDFSYIKETIKRKPVEPGRLVCRVAWIALGGVFFGICAAAAFACTEPFFAKQFGEFAESQEEVTLVGSSAEVTQTAAPVQEEAAPTPTPQAESQAGTETEAETGIQTETQTGTQTEDGASPLTPLEEYEEIYSEVLRVSEEPRKALVMVSGLTDDEDLLDNSFLRSGNAEGIIFLKTNTDIYILTYEEGLGDADSLQVTFSDGASAAAILCGTDSDTGIAVVRVPTELIGGETQKILAVASLGNSSGLLQAKPVIAIGSPAGDRDAVVYGMVTSVSGRLSVADAEYYIMATDIQGSPEGSGILLDTSGNVIGVIMQQEESESDTIRALCISQLKPLIELLSNSEQKPYTGIHGVSISDTQSKRQDIPKGIYVDSVDSDSPAMITGIQNGDIITGANGTPLKNMQAYTSMLQKMKRGETISLTISRKSAEGDYVDMKFKLTIEEK